MKINYTYSMFAAAVIVLIAGCASMSQAPSTPPRLSSGFKSGLLPTTDRLPQERALCISTAGDTISASPVSALAAWALKDFRHG
jgi:hypothetical protein